MSADPPIASRPRRRSFMLIWGILGCLVLLALWGNSIGWVNRFRPRDPATWQVELIAGVLSLEWAEPSEWFSANYWHREPGWTCGKNPSGQSLWSSRLWMPDPYHVEKLHSPSSRPGTTARYASGQELHRIQIPLWQILTLHIALCWIAIALRQRRHRREWERQQAAGDPQLLEPS